MRRSSVILSNLRHGQLHHRQETGQHHSSALPGPENVTRVMFDNGMTVLIRENQRAPLAVLNGLIPVGACHETAGQTGLAHLTASLLTRGSATYPYDAINERVESVGASLSASGDTHTTDFGLSCLTEDFADLLQILGDTLRHPTFPQKQFEQVRSQHLVYLQERDQDTSNVANLRFYEALFGRDHPYGRPNSGYPETVAALTRTDVSDFHAQHYTPRGAIVVVAGDVQAGRVLNLLEHTFGNWRHGAASQDVPPVTMPRLERIAVSMPGKVQSDIVIGATGVARSDADYYAVRVANNILGQFGMMGRLGLTVREQQGLAYYCYSSTFAEIRGGAWLAAAGVNPADVERATDSILHELERFCVEDVTAEELSDSQAYLTGVVPLTLETNDGVSTTLLSMEWHDLGLDYLLRYPDLINAVTTADVRRVAQRHLDPSRCQIVVAGPPRV